MKPLVLAVGVVFASCAYPEIGFVPDPPAPLDTGSTADADADADVESDAARDAPSDDDRAAEAETTDVADACACPSSEHCSASGCRAFPSCAALHAAAPSLGSGTYTIDPDAGGPIAPFAVYCEMVDDGGGWTLAMKLDGKKTTFSYDAALWTNNETLSPSSTALDTTEAKLASFSTMPFTALRVGMLDGTRRFIRLTVTGASLRALFAAAPITTTAGRAEWMKLVASPRLQANCDAEGVNRDFSATTAYAARARLGVFGNNELDCRSPDSYIGFGAGFVTPHACIGVDPAVVVGNFNPLGCGNTAGVERATATFGYIFLR